MAAGERNSEKATDWKRNSTPLHYLLGAIEEASHIKNDMLKVEGGSMFPAIQRFGNAFYKTIDLGKSRPSAHRLLALLNISSAYQVTDLKDMLKSINKGVKYVPPTSYIKDKGVETFADFKCLLVDGDLSVYRNEERRMVNGK